VGLSVFVVSAFMGRRREGGSQDEATFTVPASLRALTEASIQRHLAAYLASPPRDCLFFPAFLTGLFREAKNRSLEFSGEFLGSVLDTFAGKVGEADMFTTIKMLEACAKVMEALTHRANRARIEAASMESKRGRKHKKSKKKSKRKRGSRGKEQDDEEQEEDTGFLAASPLMREVAAHIEQFLLAFTSLAIGHMQSKAGGKVWKVKHARSSVAEMRTLFKVHVWTGGVLFLAALLEQMHAFLDLVEEKFKKFQQAWKGMRALLVSQQGGSEDKQEEEEEEEEEEPKQKKKRTTRKRT
jgi:ribosomal protein L12E/L44/L45/RPP1/RPP2